MFQLWYKRFGLPALVATALLMSAITSQARGPGGGGGGSGHSNGGHESMGSSAGMSHGISPAFNGKGNGSLEMGHSMENPSWQGANSLGHSNYYGLGGNNPTLHSNSPASNAHSKYDHDHDHDFDEHHHGFYGYPFLGFGLGYYPGDSVYGNFPRRWYWNNYGTNNVATNPALTVYSTGYNGLSSPAPDQGVENSVNEEAQEIPDNAVLIGVRVPDNAQIWFNGDLTGQTGPFREFQSPVLKQGRDYHYDIHARWTENGREMDQTRHLTVRAGDRIMVNFVNVAPSSRSPTQD